MSDIKHIHTFLNELTNEQLLEAAKAQVAWTETGVLPDEPTLLDEIQKTYFDVINGPSHRMMGPAAHTVNHEIAKRYAKGLL